MKLLVVFLALFCGSSIPPKLASSVAASIPQDVSDGRDKFSKKFPLVDSKEDLFAAGDDYLLRPTYDARGEILEIRVQAKYFFNERHPEWAEPTAPIVMTPSAYQDLLHRIAAVKPLGNLIRQGEVGTMLNLRTSFWDQYEKGLVERDMFRVSPEETEGVAWFTVMYFRTILGKLESKEIVGLSGPDKNYRIKVDGKWYWTSDKAFQELTVGKRVNVEASGPITQ